jgi:uncharacterized membrane protein YeiH
MLSNGGENMTKRQFYLLIAVYLVIETVLFFSMLNTNHDKFLLTIMIALTLGVYGFIGIKIYQLQRKRVM